MRLSVSLLLLVTGVVFLIFGLNASQAGGSALGESVALAPSNRSLLLTIVGVLCLLYGGVGTIFNRNK